MNINVLVIELGIKDIHNLKNNLNNENFNFFFGSSFLDIIDIIYKETLHCIIFSDFRGKEASTGYIKMFKTTNPQINLLVLCENKEELDELRSFYIQKGADFVSFYNDFSYLNNCLSNIWEQINECEEFNSKYRDLTNKFLKFIKFNYQNKNITKEFIRQTGYSYTTLYHYIKVDTNKSCNELINEIRIKNGIKLLEKTDYPLKYIAEKIGFISVQGFIKVFKNIVGETPSKFRRKYFNKLK